MGCYCFSYLATLHTATSLSILLSSKADVYLLGCITLMMEAARTSEM
jgi:hypothetical protein